jgi:hypothetical protein
MSPSATGSLVPDLDDLREQIGRIAADARKLTADISERQFNWRPEPGKWSMAQCLGHLNAAGSLHVTQIEAGIRAAREKGLLSKGPYHHGFLGNYFVSLTEPPPKMKFKAPKIMAPPPAESPSTTIPTFFALQDQVQEQIRQANGVDLGRAKVSSPVAEWLRLTLGQSLALLAAHERRHLWQAWQIRNDPQFPSS